MPLKDGVRSQSFFIFVIFILLNGNTVCLFFQFFTKLHTGEAAFDLKISSLTLILPLWTAIAKLQCYYGQNKTNHSIFTQVKQLGENGL